MSEKQQLAALLPQDLPFSEGQKQWLGGYLAGLESAYLALRRNVGESSASSLKPLTILYGSQTGNAAALAEDCANLAKAKGMLGRVVDMDEISPADLVNVERLLVITSTYGEGDMPDNAETLWQAISAEDAPRLESTHFSVLALGDSSYEHFCLAGKLWDARLEALGGSRIGERVDCDIDFDQKAEAWMEAVLPVISEKGSQETVSGEALPESKSKPQYNRRNPLLAKLKGKRVLSGEKSGKQIVHYDIDLSGSGETYEAGDVLNIIPRNRPQLVAEVLSAVGAQADEPVSWQGNTYPLGELLAEKLEIRMPSHDFFDALILRAEDVDLHKRFHQEPGKELEDFLYGKDLVDFLRAYPEAGFTAQDLVDVLKPLAPRAYSISSSMGKHGEEVHLTIGSVRYDLDGRHHHGVASTWLADQVEEGDVVPCYFAANKHFSIPADADAPMIMVGPGTGIAPFRAFLEAREASGATGDNWLFFGDRTRAQDFIYQEELLAWQDNGLLTRLELAFSRDQSEKVYVQDKMREFGEELYRWLERGAYFFVCGDALRMAKDVDRALHEVIAKHGKLSEEAAQVYVDRLKTDKRYVRDVY